MGLKEDQLGGERDSELWVATPNRGKTISSFSKILEGCEDIMMSHVPIKYDLWMLFYNKGNFVPFVVALQTEFWSLC